MMPQNLLFEDSLRRTPGGKACTRPRFALLAALLTVLISGALTAGAILAPAPVPIVPIVVLISIGCPMFAAWDAPVAFAAVRSDRAGGRALARLRQGLRDLPETEHPLGLDG